MIIPMMCFSAPGVAIAHNIWVANPKPCRKTVPGSKLGNPSNSRLHLKAYKMGVGAQEFLRFGKL